MSKLPPRKRPHKEAKLDRVRRAWGGNGNLQTANLLLQEGLNIIGLPKTIDNDIYGTDVHLRLPHHGGHCHR